MLSNRMASAFIFLTLLNFFSSTPGNGQEFPAKEGDKIEAEVGGVSSEAKVSNLTVESIQFVVKHGNRWVPVQEISFNEPFAIEVVFSAPIDSTEKRIRLDFDNSIPQQLPYMVNDGVSVYSIPNRPRHYRSKSHVAIARSATDPDFPGPDPMRGSYKSQCFIEIQRLIREDYNTYRNDGDIDCKSLLSGE